ncbi:protein tyrosine phosphatase domain-containing protein 1-like isoform X2 [Homarus americanus]|uniref:protein tyrosine phosphatase domain-containing protein 1-like isoform X2 n=1 Tax=Homarus americanus TaxID=6706 RepID=UPI001C4730CF|nr:protein tyrosine phosphatase domain-containing protein 1-like isoform X2 [Homarus americanus]
MSVQSVGGGGSRGGDLQATELKPAGLSQNKREIAVYSNYSRLSEHFRQVTPTELQCSVFCGGRRCKYENGDAWNSDDMAIPGIYSHWVTDGILAMARPSSVVIIKKELVAQFLKHDIRTVVNLQLPGEHASCGEPLNDSGFSYDPSVFMENGSYYYNFGLKDYGEPTQGGLLDMVKVMAFSLSEGKVAIHCHAGLGRTGVLVACYLVYALRVRANDAIRYVRIKRPNAVQTSAQIQVVQEFEQFILPQLCVFSNREFMKEKRNPEFTLQQYLHRQRTILHGYEARTLKNIPKLVYVVCERLLRLCGCGGSMAPPHLLAPLEISYAVGTPSFTSFFLSAQYDHETRVSYSAPQSLGSPALSASFNSERAGGVRVPSEDDSGYPGGEEFSMGEVSVPNSAHYPPQTRPQNNCITPDVPSCDSDMPERNIDSLLNDGISDQQLTDNLCYQELASQSDLRRQAHHEALKVMPPKEVYEALLVDHSVLNVELKKQLKSYRIDLNVKQSAWEKLKTETNLYLLTGLLFTWLEHLRTPVLGVDALSYIVLASSKPEVCLRKLDREVRYTLEYLVRFVSRLQPFTRTQQEAVILRLIASITQQAVPVRGTLLPAGKGYNKLREGTLRKVVEFMNKLFELVYMESRSGSAVSAASSTSTEYTNRVTPPGQVVTPPPGEGAVDGMGGENS